MVKYLLEQKNTNELWGDNLMLNNDKIQLYSKYVS